MNISNEQKENAFKYDMELSQEEESFLTQMGFELIKKDKNALINYAVLKMLENQIKSLSDKMDKSIKEELEQLDAGGMTPPEAAAASIKKKVKKEKRKKWNKE